MPKRRPRRGDYEERPLKNGGKSVRITLGYDNDGNPIRSKFQKFPPKTPKRQIEAWMEEVRTEYRGGRSAKPSDVTLLEAIHKYISVNPQWSRNTLKGNKSVLMNHTEPLQKKRLQAITIDDLRGLTNEMVTKGLSNRMCNLLKTLMFGVYKEAILQGWVTKNLAENMPSLPNKSVKEYKVFTQEQARMFVAGASESQYYPLFMVLLNTGLRVGEALCLTWDNIDLTEGKLKVTQSMDETSGRFNPTEPKNDNAKREVVITPQCGAVLANLERVDGYVFSPSVYKYKKALAELKKTCKKLGLPVMTPHDLRHTWVTLLLLDNANLMTVSVMAGHHSVAFTIDKYGHVIPAMKEGVRTQIAGLLYGEETYLEAA